MGWSGVDIRGVPEWLADACPGMFERSLDMAEDETEGDLLTRAGDLCPGATAQLSRSPTTLLAGRGAMPRLRTARVER